MTKLSVPVVRHIRENVSVLMTYAFSRRQLEEWAQQNLGGEWRQFHETVFVMAEQRAEKACLELAIFLRYLDDEEGISTHYAERSDITFGYLDLCDGRTDVLKLRDVANKIIHAAGFDWDLSLPTKPMLMCFPRETEKWARASIDVVAVSVACGSLMG